MNKSIRTSFNNSDVSTIVPKRYKAFIRWATQQDKEEFKNSKVIIPISVGQRYHEDGEFEATIKLINKSFKECTILIADTLKRHSLDLNLQISDQEEVLKTTKRKGQEWLERNVKYIEMLSIPYEISKWDEWINKDEYNAYYHLVRKLYDTDDGYRKVMHDTVNIFLLRDERQSDSRWVDCCISYLLEESAVTCLWIKEGFKFDVYPTGDNMAMIGAYERLVQDFGFRYRSLSLNIKKLSNNNG